MAPPPPLKIGYEHNTVNLLLRFAQQRADGSWDASGLLSCECFEAWVASKRGEPKKVELNFKEAVLGMLRGKSCSKTTLPVEMQEALLTEVRQKRVWPCFEGRLDEEGNPVTIGATGFRGKAEFQANSAAALARKRLLCASASFKMPAAKRFKMPAAKRRRDDSVDDASADGSWLASASADGLSFADSASLAESASAAPGASFALAEAHGGSLHSEMIAQTPHSETTSSDTAPSETSSYAPTSFFDEENWSNVHPPQQPSDAPDEPHVLPRKTSSYFWMMACGRQHSGDEERQPTAGSAGFDAMLDLLL
jgi:hypothetical protein